MRPDKTWNAGTAAVCGWLAILIVAMLAIGLDWRLDAISGERTISLLPNAGLSEARAAEPALLPRCAARDLRLVTAIEAHGEAQDIPGETLYATFAALIRARAACEAGRADEALALYDRLTLSLAGGKQRDD
ncbi:hypothetical protein [Bradyrhizobium prioriisuperbiae]|uniref:hypothetical protein n=1 Tax=Bradyrhizobium prioriisuperbiae TaxID=2854389 RepID=UPI0028E7E3BB|nr:hypothetical protein [Bradyrhizobium prioritasuperba]